MTHIHGTYHQLPYYNLILIQLYKGTHWTRLQETVQGKGGNTETNTQEARGHTQVYQGHEVSDYFERITGGR